MTRAIIALTVVAVIGGCDLAPADATGAVYRDGGQWCTATLIAPDVALTAAHCVAEGDLRFASARVVAAVPHPRWRAGATADDIAVLLLDHQVDAPVAELAAELPAAGDPLAAIGYRDGQRGEAIVRVRKVVSPTVYLDPTAGSLCHGDSGGPSFDTGGRLVSVHVRSNCRATVLDEAVAPHLEWLAEVSR